MTILIKNADIYLSDNKIIKNGFVFISGNTIKTVTDNPETATEIEKKYGDIKVIDGKGKLLLPGIYNTHTHTPMNILKNFGSDLPLQQWLFGKIIPKEQLLTPEERYWGSLAGQAEMIRSGTCGYMEMYDPPEIMLKAALAGGMRANITVAPLTNSWNGGVRKTSAKYGYAKEMIENIKSEGKGRVVPSVEIHSIYLYEPPLLPASVEIAAETSTGIHMHLHETEKEVLDSMDYIKMRPFDYFEKIGAFKVPVLAAHCVHFTEEEIKRAAEYGINVSINTSSNLKLASGFAPVKEMAEAGVHMSFGTDGSSSNNNLNIFKEMNITSLVHKCLNNDPTVLPAADVIRMASEEGARAIGAENAGVIAEGKKADLVLADITGVHLSPVNGDCAACVVYSMQSSDVVTVIVDGNILMENRELKTIDEEKVKFNVKKINERIMNTD